MKKKLLIFAVLFLISVGFIGFYQLGGFNPVNLEIQTLDLTLSGVYYRGTPQDRKLAKAFKDIQEVQEASPETRLHTIYLIEPAGKLDTMEVYIGLNTELPAFFGDWDRLNFEEKSFIVATIQANRFVMPGPERVKKKIRSFAEENGLELDGIFIDKIISPDHVEVMAPIK
ncbi:hypothetical protein [Mongoliitalea lutea]|uniref:GyrI-like small molecule binding domain-containing protein n=1 Tax=Mongoliitalea lutea TaxID=849756 RepID=A0A8J3G5D7_9BACT|nr:hypothetical protein [Mongoliitalea lutea]GHB35831.1 hypothetical protein GCM10008106_16660 [Mongoliitalea lutea]